MKIPGGPAPALVASEPVVSVIIPTYNREAYLREAVESVFSQTLSDLVLIVVDDGSTDGTRPYLRTLTDPRLRLIEHQHCANPARLRNVGLAAARGGWIAFLDSDDLWYPDKLERQLHVLRARPECRWSYTAVRRIDGQGNEYSAPPGPQPHGGWILEQLVDRSAGIALPTVMVDRRELAHAGGFDESFPRCEDYELWTRLAARSEVAALAEPLAAVRTHEGNVPTWRPEAFEQMERVYRTLMAGGGSPGFMRRCEKAYAWTQVGRAALHRVRGDYGRALKALGPALRLDCWTVRGWVELAKTALQSLAPRSLLDWYYDAIKHVRRPP